MSPTVYFFFFFNDTATTEIYTLSLHDALPIWVLRKLQDVVMRKINIAARVRFGLVQPISMHRVLYCIRRSHFLKELNVAHRSEEHTSELQSRPHLVCRLLLEKKKCIILIPFKY